MVSELKKRKSKKGEGDPAEKNADIASKPAAVTEHPTETEEFLP